jgi:hypothetical protein
MIGLLALVWVPSQLAVLQTIYWGWVLFGFIIGFVSMGPLASSLLGERVGTWFRKIGKSGRAIVIISFITGVWIVGSQVDVPSNIIGSAVSGSMISIFLYSFMNLLYSGEIDGWKR